MDSLTYILLVLETISTDAVLRLQITDLWHANVFISPSSTVVLTGPSLSTNGWCRSHRSSGEPPLFKVAAHPPAFLQGPRDRAGPSVPRRYATLVGEIRDTSSKSAGKWVRQGCSPSIASTETHRQHGFLSKECGAGGRRRPAPKSLMENAAGLATSPVGWKRLWNNPSLESFPWKSCRDNTERKRANVCVCKWWKIIRFGGGGECLNRMKNILKKKSPESPKVFCWHWRAFTLSLQLNIQPKAVVAESCHRTAVFW